MISDVYLLLHVGKRFQIYTLVIGLYGVIAILRFTVKFFPLRLPEVFLQLTHLVRLGVRICEL